MIIEALKTILDDEAAEQAAIREEIAQRGTYWAALEIWKLRRALRKREATQ